MSRFQRRPNRRRHGVMAAPEPARRNRHREERRMTCAALRFLRASLRHAAPRWCPHRETHTRARFCDMVRRGTATCATVTASHRVAVFSQSKIGRHTAGGKHGLGPRGSGVPGASGTDGWRGGQIEARRVRVVGRFDAPIQGGKLWRELPTALRRFSGRLCAYVQHRANIRPRFPANARPWPGSMRHATLYCNIARQRRHRGRGARCYRGAAPPSLATRCGRPWLGQIFSFGPGTILHKG